jgi:hypothetical protein
MAISRINLNYLREMAQYIADTSLLSGVGFSLKNSATTLAVNVRLEIDLVKNPSVRIVDRWQYPERPQYEGFRLYHPLIESAAEVESYGNSVQIRVKFGNIQPGRTAWSDGLIYFGATAPTDVVLDGFLYGDNLPSPLPVNLKLKYSNHASKTRHG